MTPLLLIDDEPDIKSLVSMCLERYDVEIVQVTDLAGALSAAERHRFCLVLLDTSSVTRTAWRSCRPFGRA